MVTGRRPPTGELAQRRLIVHQVRSGPRKRVAER